MLRKWKRCNRGCQWKTAVEDVDENGNRGYRGNRGRRKRCNRGCRWKRQLKMSRKTAVVDVAEIEEDVDRGYQWKTQWCGASRHCLVSRQPRGRISTASASASVSTHDVLALASVSTNLPRSCYCLEAPMPEKPILLAATSALLTRKPCCRKETARCRSYSFRFKVRRRHSLQV